MTVSVVDPREGFVAIPERESEARTPVPVDQLVSSLGESIEPAKKQQLLPLHSHGWFLTENYWRVMKWCTVALVRSAEQSSAAEKMVRFLVAAMVDCYHYDRAVGGGLCLPGSPAPEKLAKVPATIWHNRCTYSRHTQSLAWSPDVPLEAADGVAEVGARSMPDRFLLITYKESSSTYDPLIYAQYGDWVIKVAEWE